MAWKRVDGLRTIEFGNVGASRTALLDFVFNGNKRATAGLLEHDYEAEGDLNAADFRASHMDFWTRSGYEIRDETKVVLLYFDLV